MRHLVCLEGVRRGVVPLGFTDGRLLNASARLNLKAAGYYAGSATELAVQRG